MRQVPVTNVRDFARFKQEHRKISIVTAYDAWSAHLVERSNVDAILVGDSAAMVMHGHRTTVPATLAMMALHTAAVARVAGHKFVIADLPFLSYRNGVSSAIRAVATLMRSGAHAVKLEGVDGLERAWQILLHIDRKIGCQDMSSQRTSRRVFNVGCATAMRFFSQNSIAFLEERMRADELRRGFWTGKYSDPPELLMGLSKAAWEEFRDRTLTGLPYDLIALSEGLFAAGLQAVFDVLVVRPGLSDPPELSAEERVRRFRDRWSRLTQEIQDSSRMPI